MKKKEMAELTKSVVIELGRMRESKVIKDGEQVGLRRECEAASVALVWAYELLNDDVTEDSPHDEAIRILDACAEQLVGGDDHE